MDKAEEINYKAVTAADNQEPPKDYVISAHADHFNGFVEGYKQGYNQALQDLWHNVKNETPIDGERLLLINRNGEYGTTMLMMPILYKEFRKWEKWTYIKDLIRSE